MGAGNDPIVPVATAQPVAAWRRWRARAMASGYSVGLIGLGLMVVLLAVTHAARLETFDAIATVDRHLASLARLLAQGADRVAAIDATPSGFIERCWALVVLVVGLVFLVALPLLSPLRTLVAAIVCIVASVAMPLLFLEPAGGLLSGGGLACMAMGLLALDVVHGYFDDARVQREFATVFGPYVPPALVEQMARDPSSYRSLIVPRSETLTVLFADLRGFTAVAEQMAPEDVRLFLNDYFTEMSEVVHEFGGTVDKYIGDEVMAFWGAPLADADHARHAVLASLRMREAIGRLRSRVEPVDGEELDLRVGINTGLVSVGDMGSAFRRSYTVLGDAVNLAKRVESLTRYYGVGILIGEQTRIRVPDLVCREIDWVQVKGRGGVVTIYEPVGHLTDVAPGVLDELEAWANALQAYRLRRWQEADGILLQLQQSCVDAGLYQLYRSRIVRFRTEPPPVQWNGVTVFDRK